MREPDADDGITAPAEMQGDPAAVVFERAALDQLRDLDNDGAALRSLLELFLSVGPSRVDHVIEAANRGEVAGVEAAAHRLAGSASVVGAVALTGLARLIEQEARAGDLPGPVRLNALRAALDEVTPLITDEIG